MGDELHLTRRPPRPQACLSIYDGTIMAGFVVVRGQRFHVFGAAASRLACSTICVPRSVRRPTHPEIPAAQVVEEPPTSCLRSAIPRAHDER